MLEDIFYTICFIGFLFWIPILVAIIILILSGLLLKNKIKNLFVRGCVCIIITVIIISLTYPYLLELQEIYLRKINFRWQ